MSFWQSSSSKNREAQQQMNQANIESAERINQSQIDWSREYFDKTNAYNTPTMQMQRFKEAGLNPHLIYGQGSTGNATQPSNPPMEVPKGQAFTGSQDGIDDLLTGGLNLAQQYVGMRKQQAEIDNVDAQTQVAMAQKENVDSQTVSNYTNSAKTSRELDLTNALFDSKVRQADANLRNTDTQTRKIEQEISSSKAGERLTNAQISEVAQKIKQSVEQIKLLQMQGRNADLDSTLKQLDIDLKKNGIQPTDGMLMRILSREFGNFPDTMRKFYEWNWGTGKAPLPKSWK